MSNEFEDIDWDELAEHGFSPQDVITPNQMRRRILWDIAPCGSAGNVMRHMKISPGSDEVEGLEHQESHDRINRVGLVDPMLEELSAISAEVITATLQEATRGMMTEEEAAVSEQRLKPMFHATSRAIVAELLDLGFLHYPHLVDTEG